MRFTVAIAHAMHSHSERHLHCQFPRIDVRLDDHERAMGKGLFSISFQSSREIGHLMGQARLAAEITRRLSSTFTGSSGCEKPLAKGLHFLSLDHVL